MLEQLRRALFDTLRNLLDALRGANAGDQNERGPERDAVAPSRRSAAIIEVAAGDGPAWGTLSSLAAHGRDPARLYAVTDQDSPPLRIIEIEVSPDTARAVRQIEIHSGGLEVLKDLSWLDVEGLAIKPEGGFWLASEGGEGNDPPNILIEVDQQGRALRTIELSDEIADSVRRQGFEGVALVGGEKHNAGRLVVAFQSGLVGDGDDTTRIGAVDLASGGWRFWRYPLEQVKEDDHSGLSDILHLDGERFALIERDGRGKKSALKWMTLVDLASMPGAPPGEMPPLLRKTRVLDLVPLFLDAGRKVEKEIEGLAIAADGQVYAVTDNDNERATILLRLGTREALFARR